MVERLLVDLRDDGLVQVSSWPTGEQYPRPAGDPVELVWPLSDEDLTDLRWYLERYLRLPTAVYGERGARVAAALPHWGEQVFAAVFGSGPARDAYVAARARNGPLEIALLSKSAEQLGRPWELMVAPGSPVPVALDGVAISRTLQNTGMADVFDVPGSRLRVLMVISRPGGTADVGYQMIARPLLRRLEAVRGSVELVVLRPPTLERLGEVLAEAREAGEPFQVVHFDGHGVFGQASGAGAGAGTGWGSVMYQSPGPQGMLAFEKPGGGSDLVEAGRVAQVLAGAKVPVVVLNACQSAQVGSELEAAVATRLLAGGCASVVAMAYSVYAVAAAEFMTAFYERLFAGDRVADAVTAGRVQLTLNDKRPSMKGMLPLADWMVPVLYTRSEARFSHLRTTRSPEQSVGDILTRIREESEAGPERGGQGRDLEPVGEFVGRDADFYTLDVAARLQHVVVVHGPGGTGKTELAKAFGRWWRDTGGVDAPDWVFWHSFEPGVASFGLDGVVNAIGERLFDARFALLDNSERQKVIEEVLAARRLLLIWDNFESVREMPDPGRATPPLSQPEQDRMRGFLTRVAAGGGESAVLITSRTPESWLGPDLRRIELAGLGAEDATAYAHQLLAPYPSAQPQRQTPAFADLMRWLDGHPLSMRLTLPHLDTTTAQHLLNGLQGTAALPAADGNGNRHTSLSASIAYSFTHLSPADQEALTVLSLFNGVADANALVAFSTEQGAPERFRDRTGPQWMEVLLRAANLGLLMPMHSASAMFRLHPALPAHLAAHWRTRTPDTYATERAAAVRALVSAHAAFGGWLDGQATGGNAQLAFALIGQQRRMLGSMLGLALDHGLWLDAQLIFQPLDKYWDAQGLTEEAGSWADRARLAVESDDGTPPGLGTPAGALWLYTTGSQAGQERVRKQLDRAESTYRTMLHALEEQPRNPHYLSRLGAVYHQLGLVAHDRGRLTEAEDWFRRSLAVKEKLVDPPGLAISYRDLGLATSYHHLGSLARDRGRLTEAEDWCRRSLAIGERLNNLPGMASNYHQLGIVAQDRGRLTEAEGWYRKSVAIKESLNDLPGLVVSYHHLGVVAQLREHLEEAEDWYRRSLTINENIGNRSGMADSFHQLGVAAQLRGHLGEAEEWYRQSLTIKEGHNNLPGMAVTFGQLGLLAEERGDAALALTWTVRCVSLFEEIPHPSTVPGPSHLTRFTRQLGMKSLEETWQAVTGHPLPAAVREYVLTHQDTTSDSDNGENTS
ncbi:tetratricopeptide repeat protein [Streptomyces sp. SID3212]|uniref:CHAT domain-containing tetratricopeptide repeat protein n=1 Tax=Streptomyces sp. SID3212 TaxID=2690259 RepID=UPI001371F15F|nr:tetratricopeptide repeat protein [Streptomyces sp. SID3212]MYV55432.1 tetratricopeptide repeat protein [Streptomyces sp. SID3212]